VNTRIGLLAPLCAFITACSIPIYDSEIDWRYSSLSKQGCPDLSGRYLNRGEPHQEFMNCQLEFMCKDQGRLFLLMIGKLEGLPEYRFEKHAPLPKSTSKDSEIVYVTTVKHSLSSIELRLQDIQGIEYSSLSSPLQHERIGCYGGAMIVRTVNFSGSEGGSGGVHYSETEIRKTSDGGLLLTEWRAWRYRSKLSGKAYGEPRDAAQRSWRFAPVL
jgi:hypothetical protein